MKNEKLKYGPYLLDEGPLSGLVWVKNEAKGVRGEHLILPWVQKMAIGWAIVLDSVQILEAPDGVLCDRINSRSDDHRIKDAVQDVSKGFLKNVRESIGYILDCTECSLPSHTIDTENNRPAVVAQQVASFLDLRNLK